ncbi:sterol O-acyltransferase 1-like [Sycon ciliatum]|uniref:sterol O-acyltransferase 1-like n=1 Tax=Sycon ciliatum TaxID=27933 RepID=UPI0031F64D3B
MSATSESVNGGVPSSRSDGSIGSSESPEVDLSSLEFRLQQFRKHTVDTVNEELKDVTKDMLNEVSRTMKGLTSVDNDRAHGQKVFRARDSVLTYLLQSTHIQTLYNIFVAILIIFAVNTVISDYLEHGRLVLNFSMLLWAFEQMPIVITTWIVMKSTTLAVYPLFLGYVDIRGSARGTNRRLVDGAYLSGYIFFLGVFLVGPVFIIARNQIPPGSALIILCEQVRMIMKIHSFIRETVPRVLMFSRESKANANVHDVLPGFSQYLYFLFCPTLLYRDNYPRTEHTRWTYVISNMGQVAGCLLYVYYIFVRFCVPVFSETGRQPWNTRTFILGVMNCMLPSTMVFVLGFFSILHSWLNAFAEMMGFADRMFYKDWWNCRSWADYYRKWNVVVHDWLHAYVYNDVQMCVPEAYKKNRLVAMFTVFIVSAFVHEYIIAATFGFFFPVLLLMFGGIGVSFVFLTHQRQSRIWNIFMWVMLFFGNGLLMCLYSIEFYSRQNCADKMETWLDILIPNMLTCDSWPDVS